MFSGSVVLDHCSSSALALICLPQAGNQGRIPFLPPGETPSQEMSAAMGKSRMPEVRKRGPYRKSVQFCGECGDPFLGKADAGHCSEACWQRACRWRKADRYAFVLVIDGRGKFHRK